MSDKSHDAEPEFEENLPGEPDAPEDDAVEVEDPEALAAAEEEVTEADEDITLGELEKNFTPEEQAAAAALAPVRRRTAKAPVRKKDAATRKRSDALTEHEDPYRASNPAEFVKQSASELKKVVWPTWPQTLTMFSAVLVFVLIMITYVGLADFGFGWLMLQLFGS
ncbi:MAG: preprotein translocase subunit SecE [Propionibacteriaceae bacterium]|nr:preprotein translocase subunit SecE [Propionibacteriaceae bacterium]